MGMSVYATIGFGFIVYDQDNDARDELFDISFLDELELSCSEDIYLSEIAYDMQFNGISVETFGSLEYEEIAFLITESIKSTEWESIELEPNALEIKAEWLELMEVFQEKYGLDYVKPKWILAPYYSY